MPMPEGRRLTQNVSTVLTNMAMSYVPGLTQFIAGRVFPNISVDAPTGLYNILPRGDFIRPEVKKLANNEAAPIGGFNFTQATYDTGEYGIAASWTDRDLAVAGVSKFGGARLISAKVLYVTIQSLLGLEIDTAAIIRTAANWAGTSDGVAAAPGAGQFLRWSDPTSDPIGQVKDIILAQWLATGFKPNKIIMPPTVIRHLTEHPDLIDRIKYTGSPNSPTKVNMRSIADLFEIDDIEVPGGVVNLGKEGAADNISWIWGNDVWIGHTTPTPSMEMPSAGYHFSWNGTEGYGPQPFQGPRNEQGLFIRRYTENRPAAYFVESRYYTTPKATAAGMGYLLTNVVA
jgi:hypothetical protein